MEILLLKALGEEDFGHEFQQYDLDKFKLETKIKTLKNIFDEKQFGTKEATKITSPLNASRKLFVSLYLNVYLNYIYTSCGILGIIAEFCLTLTL